MPAEVPANFAALLRHARRGAELTQEALAERAGISVRTIADLERGVNRAPRQDTLELLAAALVLEPEERARWERLRRRLAVPDTAPASRATLAPDSGRGRLVGRERELAQVDAALQIARSGHGQIILIAGEPGIGKTRLAEETTSRASEMRFRTLWGQCRQEAGAPPYWPWIQILNAWAASQAGRVSDDDLGPGAAGLHQLVPQLRTRLPSPSPVTFSDPDQARFELFESVTRLLRHSAAQCPLLLVLDDLHWADAPTRLLLEHLAAHISQSPIVLVGTYRDADVDRAHALSGTLAELARQRQTVRIGLRGLPVGDVAALIEVTTGVEPLGNLAARVAGYTEGNPFFVTEVARLLAAEQEPAAATATATAADIRLGVPETIQDVLGRRLATLTPGCHNLLEAAAVIGRQFSLALLARALERTPAEVYERLDEALSTRIVLPEVTVGSFRFSHALVREALYERLASARRAQLHAAVAQAIERIYASDLAEHYDELAAHYASAAPLGLASLALSYSMHAGRRAIAHLAWETAVEHFERALEMLGLLDPLEPLVACEVLLALGDAQQTAGVDREHGAGPGDSASARATFERALHYARLTGSAEHFARGALGIAGPSYSVAVGGQADELLDEALATLGPSDSRLRVLVLGRLAVDCMLLPLDRGVRPAIERARELSDEAVAVARRLDDPRTLADALMARLQAQFSPDTLTTRSADVTEIARLSGDHAPHEILRDGEWYWHLSAVLAEQGDLDAAERALDPYFALASTVRKPHMLWGVEAYRSWWCFRAGQWEAAARHTQNTLHYGPIDYTYVYELFYIRREQGQLADMQQLVEAEVAKCAWVILGRAMQAIVWLESGRVDLAQRELEALCTAEVVLGSHDYLWLPAMALLCELCAALSNRAGAALLLKALTPYAAGTVQEWQTGYNLGACSRYLALVATVVEDWELAERSFAAALATNERLGMPALLAHTRAEWAEMLLRRADPADRDRAGELLDAALSTACALEMPALSARVARLRN